MPATATHIKTGGMQQFSKLVQRLGTSTKTNDKLEALGDYFQQADDKDKVWVIALFSGRRPRRTVSGTQLSEWCAEMIGLPLWLLQECYLTVGDLSETIALLIPEIIHDDHHPPSDKSLHYYVEKILEKYNFQN